MAWWIYKCNSRNQAHQRAWGDWNDFFEQTPDDHWGSAKWTPDLLKLDRGDEVIAYQTDRNELVGRATVRRPCEADGYLYLTPVERIGTKVLPLKKKDRRIDRIPALKPGPVKTLYEISASDAAALLKAARAAAARE